MWGGTEEEKRVKENYRKCGARECDPQKPSKPAKGFMPAPDSPEYLSKEDIYYLSAIGKIKSKRKKPDDNPGEHGFDKPGIGIWAWKNRGKLHRKRYPSVDGTGPYLKFENWIRSWTNWENRLRLHDPGVVDPLPWNQE